MMVCVLGFGAGAGAGRNGKGVKRNGKPGACQYTSIYCRFYIVVYYYYFVVVIFAVYSLRDCTELHH